MSALDSSESGSACGTNAGYTRHRRAGEIPCDACRAAHRTYARSWARKARTRYPVGDCAACGRRRPIQRHGWCESCVTRWQRDGRPEQGPGPLDHEAIRAARARGAEASRQYAQIDQAIRDGGWGWTLNRKPQVTA